jgi:hypothetical protein
MDIADHRPERLDAGTSRAALRWATFRIEIALMLERLGRTVISSINDIVTTEQGGKYATVCATLTGQGQTKTNQPILASVSAFRNRSISSMKPTEGTRSTSAVIAAI